jgi:hypothetical protein
VIETALVLPSPRALLPSLSADDPVPELRTACAAAVGRMLSEHPSRIVVVAAPVSAPNRARGVVEPLGHRVARHLLGTRGFGAEVALPYTAAALLEAAEPTTLVVMADGSASRGEKAPGHLHPDAVAFDDRIEAALRSGDVEALAAIDAEQATELWSSPRWPAVAGSRPRSPMRTRRTASPGGSRGGTWGPATVRRAWAPSLS